MSRPKLQPYPGLRAFERYESRIFFGRQQQVDDLLARLKQHHFLAVLGASGSGKSSLVKAGLLLGLEKGYMGEVGSRWAIAEMRPGDQPFMRLAEGLLADKVFAGSWNTLTPRPPLPEVEGEKENTALILRPSTSGRGVGGEGSLAAELRRGSRSLHEILNHAPLPAGTRLLLLVDQFEEMFRFREQEENQAAAFVALLLEACTHPDVYVVITMRSDFLGAAAEFHGLPEAINDGLYLTPRLSREQLRDAISLPAQLFGGSVEDALANHLLNEAGNDPDQLPLLQHALMRLWENDADKILTLDEYRGLRGLRGALNDHAEQAWQELDDNEKSIAETMFRALSERSKDEQDIRRPLKVQVLLDMTNQDLPVLMRVVDGFRQPGRNFLMPQLQVALMAETVLDISHESLIRQWQRLQAWVVAEGEKAAMYLRLLEAAQRHESGQGEFWHGIDLALAREWRDGTEPNRTWARRYDLPKSPNLFFRVEGKGEEDNFSLAMRFLRECEVEEQRIREVELTRFVGLMTRDTLALVLAGGRGSNLYELTDARAKPSVPFGGTFRIIDFPLSNCINSGIRRVGVLTQYKAHSLIAHLLRCWSNSRTGLGGFVEVLPASQRTTGNWYVGTADAIYQNLDTVISQRPKYVLVLAGDQVYKMDYGHMLAYHAATGADMTVACMSMPLEDAKGCSVMTVNDNHRVVEFYEKSANPPPMLELNDIAIVSMGNYIFNTEFLFEQLHKDAANPESSRDFGKDIIPSIVAEHKVYAYLSRDPVTGKQPYWRDVETIDDFWEANMELVSVDSELNLYDETWPIQTYHRQLPSVKFVFRDEGREGKALDSVVSEGCVISGAAVINSLLFSNVKVHSYSMVNDSVLLPDVTVGRDCRITRAVIDEGCRLPEGTIIGEDKAADAHRFRVTPNGITLVTPEMLGQRVSSR